MRGPTPVIRPLTAREVCRLHGHADDAYEQMATTVEGEWRQSAVATASLSALMAEAVLVRAIDRLSGPTRRTQGLFSTIQAILTWS